MVFYFTAEPADSQPIPLVTDVTEGHKVAKFK
jgi:hypothetical protein